MSVKCAQPKAAAEAGWHQTVHSGRTIDPTPNASTIEKTAARNTGCSPALGQEEGHPRVQHAPGTSKVSASPCSWDAGAGGFFAVWAKNSDFTRMLAR